MKFRDSLLEGKEALTHLVVVSRNANVTELRLVEGSALQAVSAINEQVGLTTGELLLLTRLVLFVEGEHDRAVIEEWFGEDLAKAAVRVVPLRGIDNLVGLPQSGIVQALGLPMAVLADDTDVVAAREGRPRTRGERAVADFLEDAQQHGLAVKAVGLSRPDIIDYLDADICRRVAPDFPGWSEARRAAGQAGYSSSNETKKWISCNYNLRLTTDGVRDLAKQCREAGLIPDEISGGIRRILDLASGS